MDDACLFPCHHGVVRVLGGALEGGQSTTSVITLNHGMVRFKPYTPAERSTVFVLAVAEVLVSSAGWSCRLQPGMCASLPIVDPGWTVSTDGLGLAIVLHDCPGMLLVGGPDTFADLPQPVIPPHLFAFGMPAESDLRLAPHPGDIVGVVTAGGGGIETEGWDSGLSPGSVFCVRRGGARFKAGGHGLRALIFDPAGRPCWGH